MKALAGRVVVGTISLAMLAAVGCENMMKKGDEKDVARQIDPDKAPPIVMDSIHSRFPGASVTNLEREKENGAIVYDFELKQNGRKYEADVKEDGTIMEIE